MHRPSLGLYERQIHRLEPSAIVTVLNDTEQLASYLDTPLSLILMEPHDISERGGDLLPLLNEKQPGVKVALFASTDRLLDATVEQLLSYHRLSMIGAIADVSDKETLARWIQQLKEAPAPVIGQRRDIPILTKEEIADGLETGALTLYYQPQVRIVDGALLGFEALARWERDGEVLPPFAFIPVAEREGLINELTRQVVVLAAGQVADWLLDGEDITVSVNITADDLEDPTFVPFVRDAVAKAGIPPGRLVLEVTESKIGSDLKQNQQSLAALKAAGFELAIDDFGTGYSSLEQLHRMPIMELKIDRAFVFEAWNVDERKVILSSSVGMGQRLGLHVVAEGAETLEDWRLLEELQAEICQGYFVGKPMAVSDVPAWREQWEQRKPEPLLTPVAALELGESTASAQASPKRFPKWMTAVAGVAMLLVAGSAVYFSSNGHPVGSEAVVPEPGVKRIAIIPFEISGNGDQSLENMSLSIAEELITTLAGAKGLQVIGRQSSLDYDADGQSALDFGRRFDIDQIVEGRLIELGGPLQVTLRASDVGTGTILWAERFDLEPDAFLSLRDTINKRIGQRFGLIAASEQEIGEVGIPSADREAAYKHYLTGRQMFRRGTSEDLALALQNLRAAMSLDPSSVDVLALLARVTITSSDAVGFYNAIPLQDAVREARSYVRSALEMDPSHAEAHLAQGMILSVLSDYEAANRAFERALELDPTLSYAHQQLVVGNFALGRLQGAIGAAQGLAERDPLSAGNIGNLATMLGLAGREEEARAVVSDLKRTFPDLGEGWLQQATLDIQTANFDAAKEALDTARSMDKDDLRIDALMALLGIQTGDYALVQSLSLGWYMGRALLGAGDVPAALNYVDAAIERSPGDKVALEDWFYVYVLAGRYQEAADRAKALWPTPAEAVAAFDYTYLPHPAHLFGFAVQAIGDAEYFSGVMKAWRVRIETFDANGWHAPSIDIEKALFEALSGNLDAARMQARLARERGYKDLLMLEHPALK